MHVSWICVGFGVLVALLAGRADADVRLPAIFNNDMVLQRQMPIPVWGGANPGEAVRVTLGPRTGRATADKTGRWRVTLDALEAEKSLELTVTGRNVVVIKNVAVGEVWVFSGQSNMELVVGGAMNAEKEMAGGNQPDIRQFGEPGDIALAPRETTPGDWSVATPKSVRWFSAIGYFMAREIHEKMKVPVGIINISWSGTAIDGWMPEDAVKSIPQLRPMADARDEKAARFATGFYDRHARDIREWLAAADLARAAGRPVPPPPFTPAALRDDPRSAAFPAGYYNALIAPLTAYPIRGICWYQGEANVDTAQLYRNELPALIKGWRHGWLEAGSVKGDSPFLIVQLPNFQPVQPQPTESAWAELREAQAMAAKMPAVGLAVTIDIGEAGNLHPPNKQDVSHRLFLQAERLAYGRDVVASGPVFDSFKVEGRKIRLSFTPSPALLAAKGGEILKGFAMAGSDRKFTWADATIDGNTIVVSSEAVAVPTAVRYDWADNPTGNLANSAGLPAGPFRTDDWAGITRDKPKK